MIKTNIGNVALEVGYAGIKADKQEKALEKLVNALVFHDAASKAYGAKSKFSRASDYSPAKRDHVVEAVKGVLDVYLDGVVISGDVYVAPESEASKVRKATYDSLVKSGVDDAILRSTFPEFYTEPAKAEAVVDAPVAIG